MIERDLLPRFVLILYPARDLNITFGHMSRSRVLDCMFNGRPLAQRSAVVHLMSGFSSTHVPNRGVFLQEQEASSSCVGPFVFCKMQKDAQRVATARRSHPGPVR